MMGQTIKSCTGLCDIFIDEQLISSTIESENIIDEENDINILLNINEDKGDCMDGDFKFSFE